MGLYLGKNELQKAKRELLEALQRVEINQSNDGSYQGFQIAFAIQRPLGRSTDYALLKEPMLSPGNRVVITITIFSQPRVLMDGIITHQQIPSSEGGSEAQLVVMGKDISVLMGLEDKNLSYKGMKHKEVVEQILSRYTKFGIIPKVETPTTKWPVNPPKQMPAQYGTSDRLCLGELAEANGFKFYLLPGPTPGKSTAYWGPSSQVSNEHLPISVNMGTRTNVESINFAFDAQAAATVRGGVSDADSDKSQMAESTKRTDKPARAKKDPFGENRTLLRSIWLGYAGPDANEAQARAQALTNRLISQAVTATGTLNTLRYGDLLMIPGYVAVRGTGGTYDGEYVVESVKHRISGSEYKQEFTLTREGVGTTIQKVKV